MKLYDDSKRYYNSGYRTDHDNYFKVYKGKRVIRNYEGIAEPVIREAHTIIETLVSNIASGNPKFHFVVTNEEQSNDTEVLNEMLDYFLVCNEFALKNQEWVRDMLLYGTGILHVSWCDGKPVIENIPLRDFFFDTASTGLVKTVNPSEYAGYEYLANRSVLDGQKIYDAEKKAWVKRYDLVGIAASADKGKDGDQGSMDKAFKDMFQGSTLGEDATKDQIHVIKLYHLPTGRIYEVGNKKKLIYNQPTWLQRKEMKRDAVVTGPNGEDISVTQQLDKINPFLPFAILRDYIDTSQFLGAGEMELIFNDAELLNDYEAMQVDNNAYQNTPMYWIDPEFADLADEIETIPGAIYPLPRNAMGAIERPQLSGDLDNKEDRILARMRRATAADEAVQGVSQSQSRTTATEVSTQLQQAQTRFSTKISNLESEGYAQLATIIFKLIQIFITKAQSVRIVGSMGNFFKDFDPWEFNGQYEAHAQLDSTIKSAQAEVGQRDNQVYELLANDPNFNQVEVKRWIVKMKDPTMTDEKFNKMLAPAQAPQPSPEEIKATSDVEKAKIAAYASIYRWSPALVQGEIETKLNLEADPSHQGDAQNKMLEQANQANDHMDPATSAMGGVIPGLEAMMNPTPATAPAGLQTATA